MMRNFLSKKLQSTKSYVMFLLVFMISSALILPAGNTPYTAMPAFASEKDLSQNMPSFADLSEKLNPAVVNISTTKTITTGGITHFGKNSQKYPFEDFFGGEEFFRRFFKDMPERKYKQKSLGSGFLISKDGYIFTNSHVIEKADEILVKLSDGKEYAAKVKGKDQTTDIALLKIEPEGDIPIVKMGNSSKLRVGDWVLAIGNPFGLSQTVTAGIVSAKGRIIGAGPYDDFIQTDASINPGNSGGPLFNLKGEVVGINTAIVAHGQGIGFAIPIDMARKILPDLKTTGKVTRGWFGISVQDITEEIAGNLKLKNTKGVLVSDVFKGDPADTAGIKIGDIILKIEDTEIHSTHELLLAVAAIPVGKRVTVTIFRNGQTKIFKVEVKERPGKSYTAQLENEQDYFGLTVQKITPEIAQHFGLDTALGVVITNVKENSDARDKGIKEGDIIIQINRESVKTLEDYRQLMSKASNDESVLLLIQRGPSKFFTVLPRS